MGTEFWGGLLDWVRAQLVARGLIGAGDVDLFCVTDDVEQVVAACRGATARRWRTADDAPV